MQAKTAHALICVWPYNHMLRMRAWRINVAVPTAGAISARTLGRPARPRAPTGLVAGSGLAWHVPRARAAFGAATHTFAARTARVAARSPAPCVRRLRGTAGRGRACPQQGSVAFWLKPFGSSATFWLNAPLGWRRLPRLRTISKGFLFWCRIALPSLSSPWMASPAVKLNRLRGNAIDVAHGDLQHARFTCIRR